MGARLNSEAVSAEAGGANGEVGGDKAKVGVANANVGGASVLRAGLVDDVGGANVGVGGAKGSGRGQRSGRLGGRGRLRSSLGLAVRAAGGGRARGGEASFSLVSAELLRPRAEEPGRKSAGDLGGAAE